MSKVALKELGTYKHSIGNFDIFYSSNGNSFNNNPPYGGDSLLSFTYNSRRGIEKTMPERQEVNIKC